MNPQPGQDIKAKNAADLQGPGRLLSGSSRKATVEKQPHDATLLGNGSQRSWPTSRQA